MGRKPVPHCTAKELEKFLLKKLEGSFLEQIYEQMQWWSPYAREQFDKALERKMKKDNNIT